MRAVLVSHLRLLTALLVEGFSPCGIGFAARHERPVASCRGDLELLVGAVVIGDAMLGPLSAGCVSMGSVVSSPSASSI
jgi:hypothetical protein